jgi:glutathione S-transferase
MLKIYGQYRSRAFRVIWLCKESNIEYEHVDVTINVAGATAKEPWYAEINPNERVPSIGDDGVVMWESAAINMWLAEKYDSPLYPRTLAGKARMLQWAFYIANDVEPHMITVMQHRVMFPPEKRVAATADEADAKLQPKLRILEEWLAKHKFFGDNRWDMGDFMVASVCYSMWLTKYDLSKYPKFDAWLKASVERPAAKEARKLRE